MRFYSPLRYPGGKNKLSRYIEEIVIKNNLTGGVYVEPYAGGASVALNLLINNTVSEVIINDFDKSIYAFWYSVLNKTEELCQLIERSKISLFVREKQKSIQLNKNSANILELGFSTLFLNRTNYSGIISGGPIGGVQQDGVWRLNSRFRKEEIIKRIRTIANYKNRIKLYNLDALDLLKIVEKENNKKTFIYFDPPYYVKGKQLYVNFYTHEDHLLVSKAIKNIERSHWIVSYDNIKEIKEMYKGTKKIIYSLNYSIGSNIKAKEVMFFDPNLLIPNKV